MRFTPRTSLDIEREQKETAKKFAPWPSGQYNFEVLSGQDTTSKSGNDMIVVELAVYNEQGDQRIIKDYLLESMAVKFRHAAEACGLARKYDTGSLEGFDFAGKTGKVVLAIEPGKDGYAPKNKIRDYVSEPAHARAEERVATKAAPTRQPVRQMAPVGGNDLDDEIPF